MRLSVVLLAVSAAGMTAGAYLIAEWVVGLVMIFWFGMVGVAAVMRDYEEKPVKPSGLPEPIERWRRSS